MPVAGHILAERLNFDKRLIKETTGLQYFQLSGNQLVTDKSVAFSNK